MRKNTSAVIVPEACLRLFFSLLLTAVFSGLSGCDSDMHPDFAAADDSAAYADSIGRDYALHSPDFVRGNEYEMGHVALDIVLGRNNSFASDARDIPVVSAVVPTGVNITSTVLAYDAIDGAGLLYRRADECDVGARITCHFEAELIGKASLEIDYKIFAPGDHEFTASIDTRESDPDPANNARTIIFRYVASTRYLQSLLDAAEPNGSVILPSGTYMGTLHGGDRLLTVHGADDGGTVLLSDNPDIPLLEHIGTGSILSNLEFRSSGAPVLVRSGYNITIRDSLITPIQGAWHDLQQLFVNNSYRLLYSRVEGWGGENGFCRSLLVAEPYSSNTRPSGIYIQNTLFRDNTCNNLLLEYSTKTYPVDANAPVENANPSLFILNNTFINNKGRIRFSGNRDSDVQIRNNIFVAHRDRMTLPPAIDQSGEHRFILARNLVWDSHFKSLLTPVAAAGPTVWIEASDITTDPLFADRDGGDFSLVTGSPAIDAGATIDAYLWTDPRTGAGVVPPVQAREPTPLDGLLDGKAIMDIGAFEYIP